MFGAFPKLHAEKMKRIKQDVQPLIFVMALELLDEKTRGPEEPRFSAEKHPMVSINFMGRTVTYV